MRSTPRPRHNPAASAALAVLLVAPFAGAQTGSPTTLPGELPVRFVPNTGQWNSPEIFRAQVGGLQVFLEPSGWSFWLRESVAGPVPAGARPRRGLEFDADAVAAPARAVALRMEFVGGRAPRLVPEHELSGRTTYALGADPSRHRHDVPGFASVRYQAVYDGVDVRVHEGDGHFEYDLLLEPGADLAQVELRVAGARSMAIDEAGRLVLGTLLGDVVQPRPTTWMVGADGARLATPCDYELRGDGRFGFVAPERDGALPLVVDPPIVYSSFVGGSSEDIPYEHIEDANGRILICGRTQSFDFPVSVGVLQSALAGGSTDGYIVCIDPSLPPASQVVFATYFGGTGDDQVQSVRVLSSGAIAFGGATRSLDLPTSTVAVQTTHGGDAWDGFVGVLDPTGATLLALSYFGGTGLDAVNGILEGASGELLISGNTRSANLSTTPNAFQPNHRGGSVVGQDGFVAVLDPLVSTLLYSTYLGGTGDEYLWIGHVGATGVVTMMGATSSTDIPTSANAYDTTYNGGSPTYWWASDVFVVQLDPSRSGNQQLVYGSYFGGSGFENGSSVDVAASGEIVVSGSTTSSNLPTTPGAYQRLLRGGGTISTSYVAGDAFVCKLDPSASGAAGLTACTYVGGTGQDQGLESAIDANGDILLVGWSQATSNNFPTTPDALRRSYGANDGYVVHLSADLTQMLHGSLLGGRNSSDGAWLVESHGAGMPTVCGATSSPDFPVVNGAQATYGGGSDTFVARMDLNPIGSVRVGRPTAHPNGSPTIHALGDATPGNPRFGFACSRVAPSRPGFLLLSLGSAPATPVLGVDLYVDLVSLVVSVPVANADYRGESSTTFTYPASGAPSLTAQYVWVEGTAPLALSASDAVRIN